MEERAPRGYARLIMSADTDPTRSAAADAAAAPLDLLLGDAATGMLRRMNPGGSGLRLAASLAARPRMVAGRGTRLAGELARIAVGRSQVQPSRRDRRFADPGWTGNPLLRRTMQAYLATAESVEGVVAEAGLDERDSERVGFVLTNLIDALAPSNNPLLNPAAVKAAARHRRRQRPGGPAAFRSPTWRFRRGCRPWSSRTRSKSGWTWPSRPGRWSCEPRSSS